jgi:hypothetical protein
MTEEIVVGVIGSIATAVGVGVASITIYYQKKQYKLSALIEVFKLLNSSDHREARKIIYGKYKGKADIHSSSFREALAKQENTDIIIQDSQAMVRADFDQMGALSKNELIPECPFLDAYWHTVLMCWKALEGDIVGQRNQRQNPAYMKNFEELKNKAEAYRKKVHADVPVEIH